MARRPASLLKTQADCRSILEATRGKIPRGKGTMLDRALQHLSRPNGSGEWLSVATVLVLAALYIEGRGSVGPSVFSFPNAHTLCTAAVTNFSSYTPETRVRLCELLSAPLVFDGHAVWGRYSYASDNKEAFRVEPKSLLRAVIKMGVMWSSTGLPRMAILDAGLVRGWLAWHKDFWVKDTENYVAGVNVAQSGSANKVEAALSFLAFSGVDDTPEASLIAQEFCKYLGLEPSDILQIHVAQRLGGPNYGRAKVAWADVANLPGLVHLEKEHRDRSLQSALCGESVYSYTTLTTDRDASRTSSISMYARVLSKVTEPGMEARKCVDAVRAAGTDFDRTLSGYHAKKREYIGGSSIGYSGTTQFHAVVRATWAGSSGVELAETPVIGGLAAVLDNIVPTMEIATQIAEAVDSIVLQPLLASVRARVDELLPVASSLGAYCAEVLKLRASGHISCGYRYDKDAALEDISCPVRYIAQKIANDGADVDRTVSGMVATAIDIAEATAHGVLLSGLTTKKIANEEKLTVTPVSFGD